MLVLELFLHFTFCTMHLAPCTVLITSLGGYSCNAHLYIYTYIYTIYILCLICLIVLGITIAEQFFFEFFPFIAMAYSERIEKTNCLMFRVSVSSK